MESRHRRFTEKVTVTIAAITVILLVSIRQLSVGGIHNIFGAVLLCAAIIMIIGVGVNVVRPPER